MRTIDEFQKINKNNPRLNCKNIRNKADKCGEYFTDEEIESILFMFIVMSRKILTVTYLVDYMRYQILYTNFTKDIYSNGYMEYENQKYGDFFHFKGYIKGSNRRELLYSTSDDSNIDSYDNKKYILKFDCETGDDYWEVIS